MVEVLSAANIMNANGKNSEGIEGFSEMLKELSEWLDLTHLEGEVAKKEYEEYSEWFEDRSKNLGFKIKIGKSEIAEQQANWCKRLSSYVTELQGAAARRRDHHR